MSSRRARGRDAVPAFRRGARALLHTDDALPLSGRMLLGLARLFLKRDDPARALRAARRAAARHPSAAEPRALAAMSLARLDRANAARVAAREAFELNPTSLTVARAVAPIAAAAGDADMAARAYRVALDADPGNASLRRRLAESLLDAGRPVDAAEVIEPATHAGSGPRLWRIKATALAASGRPRDAAEAFLRAIEAGAKGDAVFEELGRALAASDGGAETVERIRSVVPEERAARAMSVVALHAGLHALAVAYAEEGLRRRPEERALHSLRDRALRLLDEDAARGPALRARARDLIRQGRYEEADKAAQESLEIEPETPEGYSLRARALSAAGHVTAAMGQAQRARALTDDPRVRALEERIGAWVTVFRDGWVPEVPGAPLRFTPRPGRVLHLLDRSLPHLKTGYTQRSSYVVAAERAAGLDPVVATRLGFPLISGVREFPLSETVEGVEHRRLVLADTTDYEGMPRDRYLTLYATAASALAEEIHPAVVHAATSYLNGLVAVALKRRYGLPFIYEVRAFYDDLWASSRGDARASEGYAGRRGVETLCMKEADLIVTLAEVMRDEIASRGVDRDRIMVVPNAIDPERFRPRPKDPALATRLGIEGRAVLGYVSNLTHWEDVDSLIAAVRILRDRGRAVGAVIVGDGPELDRLRALVTELGLEADVRLTGRIPHDEVAAYYALIDVFVVPRRRLRLCELVTPLKPVEAMAMGRPLLVSDLPALREIVGGGARGSLFTPEDPESLASGAESLIDDPALAERLADVARAWVTTERTWARNGERYREAYERLLRDA